MRVTDFLYVGCPVDCSCSCKTAGLCGNEVLRGGSSGSVIVYTSSLGIKNKISLLGLNNKFAVGTFTKQQLREMFSEETTFLLNYGIKRSEKILFPADLPEPKNVPEQQAELVPA